MSLIAPLLTNGSCLDYNFTIMGTRAQDYLARGCEFFKQKDFERAEELLLAAFKAYGPKDGGRRTAAIHLGKLYRQSGRYEDAIASLIKGLPFPAAFTELISIHRFFARAAKKEGDTVTAATEYQKMFSLAKMSAVVTGVVREDQQTGWERAADWILEVQKQCGTLYPYQYEGSRVEGELLSETDYTMLNELKH